MIGNFLVTFQFLLFVMCFLLILTINIYLLAVCNCFLTCFFTFQPLFERKMHTMSLYLCKVLLLNIVNMFQMQHPTTLIHISPCDTDTLWRYRGLCLWAALPTTSPSRRNVTLNDVFSWLGLTQQVLGRSVMDQRLMLVLPGVLGFLESVKESFTLVLLADTATRHLRCVLLKQHIHEAENDDGSVLLFL